MSSIAEQIRQCEEKIQQLRSAADRIKFDLAVEEAVLIRLRTINEAMSVNSDTPTKIPGSVASRIEGLFVSTGGPMNVNSITEALEKAGVSSESTEGLKPTVAAALSRRKDLFVRVGKGEWDLASRQKQLEPQGNGQE